MIVKINRSIADILLLRTRIHVGKNTLSRNMGHSPIQKICQLLQVSWAHHLCLKNILLFRRWTTYFQLLKTFDSSKLRNALETQPGSGKAVPLGQGSVDDQTV